MAEHLIVLRPQLAPLANSSVCRTISAEQCMTIIQVQSHSVQRPPLESHATGCHFSPTCHALMWRDLTLQHPVTNVTAIWWQ